MRSQVCALRKYTRADCVCIVSPHSSMLSCCTRHFYSFFFMQLSLLTATYVCTRRMINNLIISLFVWNTWLHLTWAAVISGTAAVQSVYIYCIAAVNTKLSLFFYIAWYFATLWRRISSCRPGCFTVLVFGPFALIQWTNVLPSRHFSVLMAAEWRSWWALTHHMATLLLHHLGRKISSS